MTVLKNARLIPALTEGCDAAVADVILEDGLIKEILPAGGEYESCREVDLGGKTLLPGMIDLHTHLYFTNLNFAGLSAKGQNETLLDAFEYARKFLRQGFTTIRDCGNPYYIGVAVREAEKRGLLPLPRVITSGKAITPTEMGNYEFASLYREADSPQELVKACREDAANDVDFIKYMATGAVANPKGIPGMLITTEEEMSALVRAADAKGLGVAVHCHGKQGILLSAKLGIHTIEHASCLDGECIEALLKCGGKTALVPTLGPIGLMREGYLGEEVSQKIRNQPVVHEAMLKAARAGVLTGWGTDVSHDFFRRFPGYEFMLRRERGYSNLEILRQATIDSAKILGLDSELGTVKAGKKADLAVIDGNPDEDISVMTALPHAVYKNGILI